MVKLRVALAPVEGKQVSSNVYVGMHTTHITLQLLYTEEQHIFH